METSGEEYLTGLNTLTLRFKYMTLCKNSAIIGIDCCSDHVKTTLHIVHPETAWII